ncbi:MAG: damage-control phosphatase ARMT1 family protein [Anaerolineales bacterium]|nr:damage-control phosphatase ARMT1 family protein [Anaerolineales bacterium]
MSDNPERWRNPPPPLRGAERGSWAHKSIVERLPEIGRRTLAQNDFPLAVRSRIEELIEEIPRGQIHPIRDPGAPDAESWERYVAPHEGSDWLQPPWFFVETYFYRRIVAACGYFQADIIRPSDPFRYEKSRGLEDAPAVAESALRHDDLASQLLAALWGNQADLSLWPDGHSDRPNAESTGSDRILRDDRDRVLDHLATVPDVNRIDILLDNAGAELAADLSLTDNLLRSFPGAELYLHAKAHPTFVSDATVFDVEQTLHTLRESAATDVAAMAGRLQRALADGRLRLRAPLFWTSPLPAWELPAELMNELAASNLLISKGDANYRRLLGDRHWTPTAPIAEILSYLPTSAAALRTLKSDVVAGLNERSVHRAEQADPDWMINGRWAAVQFAHSGS